MTKNRWVQLVGSLIAMIMIANLQYAWTLFVRPLQQATGWKLSEVQLGFTPVHPVRDLGHATPAHCPSRAYCSRNRSHSPPEARILSLL